MTRPKPKALKVMEGGAGEKRTTPTKSAGRIAVPTMPVEAQELWQTLAPHLKRMGLLDRYTAPALKALCMAWQVMNDSFAELVEDGLTKVDKRYRDVKRTHPAMTAWNQATTQFRHYLGEFGLTPSSAARLDVPVPAEPDEMEVLLDEA